MKIGKNNRKITILITGLELDELQRHVWMMAESFGLDRRIENYQGKRPIGLYRWDIECLTDVMNSALEDSEYYPSITTRKYLALAGLRDRLKQIYKENFDNA